MLELSGIKSGKAPAVATSLCCLNYAELGHQRILFCAIGFRRLGNSMPNNSLLRRHLSRRRNCEALSICRRFLGGDFIHKTSSSVMLGNVSDTCEKAAFSKSKTLLWAID